METHQKPFLETDFLEKNVMNFILRPVSATRHIPALRIKTDMRFHPPLRQGMVDKILLNLTSDMCTKYIWGL